MLSGRNVNACVKKWSRSLLHAATPSMVVNSDINRYGTGRNCVMKSIDKELINLISAISFQAWLLLFPSYSEVMWHNHCMHPEIAGDEEGSKKSSELITHTEE